MAMNVSRHLTPIKDGYLFTLVRQWGHSWCLPNSERCVACGQWLRRRMTFSGDEAVIRLTEEPHKGSEPITFRRNADSDFNTYQRRISDSHWAGLSIGALPILDLFTISCTEQGTTLHISVSPP